MKAIILAAGKGTRMWPLGETTHKLLMPIFNKPLIHNFINILNGIVDEIIFVLDTGDFGKQIQEYVSQNNFPMKISYVFEDEPKGTAHAFQCAAGLIPIGEKIICMYGDDIYFRKDIENILKHEYAAVGKKVLDPEKWGIFLLDENGYLKTLVEKPQEYIGDLANIGLYLLDTDIFELNKKIELSVRGEYEFTDTVTLFAQNKKVSVINGDWTPIGYPWHILDAHESLSNAYEYKIEGIVEEGVVVNGRLSLGKRSIIKSGTYLEGDIIIGEDCIIGPNCYLRGVAVIGDNCKVGNGCEIKNSTLFSGTKVPHISYIGDSVLGYNVNVGAGSIVSNYRHDGENISTMVKFKLMDTRRKKIGTIIGDNSKLGVGTRIYPGRKLGTNSTTLPGEIVKQDK
ncbi:MAG: bifunctional sugar-1-phosphate nucleotidylyltransferase/acetyltransferase [bacterium]